MQGFVESSLTDRGKAQAANLGEILNAARTGEPAFAIHCSPQGRALETAKIICRCLDADFGACKIDDTGH